MSHIFLKTMQPIWLTRPIIILIVCQSTYKKIGLTPTVKFSNLDATLSFPRSCHQIKNQWIIQPTFITRRISTTRPTNNQWEHIQSKVIIENLSNGFKPNNNKLSKLEKSLRFLLLLNLVILNLWLMIWISLEKLEKSFTLIS